MLNKKCVLFVLFIPLTSVCQDQKRIDSLNTVLSRVSGIDKVDPLIELIRTIYTADKQRAIAYAAEARTIAETYNDSLKILLSYRISGQLFNMISNVPEAEKYLLKALPIVERLNLPLERFKVLNNLGIAYTYANKYDKALEVYQQCLVMIEQRSVTGKISVTNMNLGLLYYKTKQPRKAIEHYKVALASIQREENPNLYSILLSNAGLAYQDLGAHVEAKKYFNLALQDCADTCRDDVLVGLYFGLGLTEFHMGKVEQAKSHLNQSLQLARKMGDQRYLVENYIFIGQIECEKDSQKGLKMLKDAEELSIKLNNSDLQLSVYFALVNIYFKQSDYKEANHYQEKYILLKDSVHNAELYEKLGHLEAEFHEKVNIEKIASQAELLHLRDRVIETQQFLVTCLVALAILLAVLLFVLYKNLGAKKKINLILEQRVKERTEILQKELSEIQNKYASELHTTVKVYGNIHDDLASLIGLCKIAEQDVTDPVGRGYLSKVEKVSQSLSGNFNSLKEIR